MIASWFGLGALLVLIAIFGTDAGVAYDEIFQLEYGDRILRWFRSGFHDQGALSEESNLYLYGGLFDAAAQWLVKKSPLGPYETRHILSALCAVLGIIGSWKIAQRIAGDRAGFLAALILAFTPTWIGHGLFNPKDIPFGAAAVFVSYASVRLALGPTPVRWRDAARAGLALGCALGTRPGGVFLVAFPFLAAASRYALTIHRRHVASVQTHWAALLGRTALRMSCVIPLAWSIMLIAWPWAQLSPFTRPLEAMRAASHFEWDADVLFDGEFISSMMLPLRYLPTWFAISLPETYLLSLGCGCVAFWFWFRRPHVQAERALALAVVATSVLMPLTAAIVLRAVIYDAQRHFLFLIPPAAALCGIALSEFMNAPLARGVRTIVTALLMLSCSVVGLDMVRLHPYEYVYFNHASGGLKHAYEHFETDYWGLSYREGLAWLVQNPPTVRRRGATRISTCDETSNQELDYYLQRWPGAAERFKIVSGYRHADVFLALTRTNCHRVPGKQLHRVEREGVPLLFIFRTRHGNRRRGN